MSTPVSDPVGTAYGEVYLSPLISEDSHSCPLLWHVPSRCGIRGGSQPQLSPGCVISLPFLGLAGQGAGRATHCAMRRRAATPAFSCFSLFFSGLLLVHLCHTKTAKPESDSFGSARPCVFTLSLRHPEFPSSVPSLSSLVFAWHRLSPQFPPASLGETRCPQISLVNFLCFFRIVTRI